MVHQSLHQPKRTKCAKSLSDLLRLPGPLFEFMVKSNADYLSSLRVFGFSSLAIMRLAMAREKESPVSFGVRFLVAPPSFSHREIALALGRSPPVEAPCLLFWGGLTISHHLFRSCAADRKCAQTSKGPFS
jgi:hypothetical protein